MCERGAWKARREKMDGGESVERGHLPEKPEKHLHIVHEYYFSVLNFEM